MEKIRVLLADDYAVVRQGLKALLEAEVDITVVGEADNGHLAVQLARELSPAVIIMDIVMPLLNGLEATRQIRRESPGVKVLVLTAFEDDKYVRQMTEAGAAGYLLKQADATDLIKAVREARNGNAFFSPAIAARLAAHCRTAFLDGAPKRRRNGLLTPRETEVLQLIAEGKANKQIATELFISPSTVVKHRQQLMNKLNLHNSACLTRYAIAEGIIEATPAGCTGPMPGLADG